MITLYNYDKTAEYKDWFLKEHGAIWNHGDEDHPKFPYNEFKKDRDEYDYEYMGHIYVNGMLDPDVSVLVINDTKEEYGRRITYHILPNATTVLDLFESEGGDCKVFYATEENLVLKNNFADGVNYHTFRIIKDEESYKKIKKAIDNDLYNDISVTEMNKIIEKHTKNAADIVFDYYAYLEGAYDYDPLYEDETYRKLVMEEF